MIRTMRRGEIIELDSLRLANLAGDLTSLVDHLQADWDDRRTVRPETAQELHEMRERAERLLCDFASA